MIPLKVCFTGLEFDPMDLLKAKQIDDSFIPLKWLRVSFKVDRDASIEKIRKWTDENTDGHFKIYSIQNNNFEKTVVIAFELDIDAMMFRLKEGNIAWNED